jgi:hypothetical protein
LDPKALECLVKGSNNLQGKESLSSTRSRDSNSQRSNLLEQIA